MEIVIAPVRAGEVESVRHQIAEVYGAAFAPPPYAAGDDGVRRFASSVSQHAVRPGFRCFVARRKSDGPLLGFAYGYTGAPGHWWHDVIARALRPEVAARWLADYFEVVQLAVAPEVQRRGLGGRLHDALLTGLPHRTAVLSTAQSETPALRLYRKRGWLTLAEDLLFPGIPLRYRIMGLDLIRVAPPEQTG